MSDSPEVSLTRERSNDKSAQGLWVEARVLEDLGGLVGVLNGTRVWLESGEGVVGLNNGDGDGGWRV
jgi:hypothetical protein